MITMNFFLIGVGVLAVSVLNFVCRIRIPYIRYIRRRHFWAFNLSFVTIRQFLIVFQEAEILSKPIVLLLHTLLSIFITVYFIFYLEKTYNDNANTTIDENVEDSN